MRTLIALVLAACAAPQLDAIEQDIITCTTTIPDTSGVGRPDACVSVPTGTMPAAGWPLFEAWHVYGDTYGAALSRLGMNQVATWAIVIAPEGLLDAHNARYFDAGDVCCDEYDADPDDVSYGSTLVTSAIGRYTVDLTELYTGGLSNGGVMAAAMLCADSRFAAGIEAAGVPTPPCVTPIVLRKAHGRSDHTLYFNANDPGCPGGPPCRFEGLSTLTPYASADDPTPYGCTGYTATGTTKDYNASVSGAESTEYAATGCGAGTVVEFWDMASTVHVPSWTSAWQTDSKAWLLAHHK